MSGCRNDTWHGLWQRWRHPRDPRHACHVLSVEQLWCFGLPLECLPLLVPLHLALLYRCGQSSDASFILRRIHSGLYRGSIQLDLDLSLSFRTDCPVQVGGRCATHQSRCDKHRSNNHYIHGSLHHVSGRLATLPRRSDRADKDRLRMQSTPTWMCCLNSNISHYVAVMH